jgi:hypothetical protein
MVIYADAKGESVPISKGFLCRDYDKQRGETMRKSTYNFDTRERDTKAV